MKNSDLKDLILPNPRKIFEPLFPKLVILGNSNLMAKKKL